MGRGAADQRGDTLGWGLLSSACPHAAPYPSAARIPARSPSDGVTSVGTSDACQRAARQPCQLSLGWEKSNAAVRPSLRAFAIVPVAPRPSAVALQLSPCSAGRDRLAWGLPGGAPRGCSTGWPSEGVLQSCGICAERGGDRTARMAAPSWEGVPEPAPSEGRERSPGAGGVGTRVAAWGRALCAAFSRVCTDFCAGCRWRREALVVLHGGHVAPCDARRSDLGVAHTALCAASHGREDACSTLGLSEGLSCAPRAHGCRICPWQRCAPAVCTAVLCAMWGCLCNTRLRASSDSEQRCHWLHISAGDLGQCWKNLSSAAIPEGSAACVAVGVCPSSQRGHRQQLFRLCLLLSAARAVRM